MKHPQYTEEVSRQIWKRIYFEDIDATEPDSLAEVHIWIVVCQARLAEYSELDLWSSGSQDVSDQEFSAQVNSDHK